MHFMFIGNIDGTQVKKVCKHLFDAGFNISLDIIKHYGHPSPVSLDLR